MANQLTVKDLISQIKKNTELASKRPDQFSPAMRQGAERRIREAQDSIESLKDQYVDAVVKNSVILAVDGPGAKSFAEIAKETAGMVAVNYLKAEEEILEAIRKSNGTPLFGNYEYQIVLNSLNLLKRKYKINAKAPLGMYTNLFGEKTEKVIPKLLRSVFGEFIHSAVAAKELGAAALAAQFEGKKLGVVLYNNSGSVDTAALPSPIMQATSNENVTTEEVALVLETMSQVLTKTTVGSTVKASNEIEPKIKRGRPKKSSKDQEQLNNKE